MLCFDKFGDGFKKMNVCECVRKNSEIIKLWIREENVQCGEMKIAGMQYHTIKFEDVDKLCEFISKAQSKYL